MAYVVAGGIIRCRSLLFLLFRNCSVLMLRSATRSCLCVFLTLNDMASTILISVRGCHSRTRSQRSTKANGSHHGDNFLLRPTRIPSLQNPCQVQPPDNIKDGFNDWGGRGYDDFVPGEVIKTAPSGDETT